MYRLISRLISIYDIILSPVVFVGLIYTAVVLMLYQHEIFETQHDGKTVELWTMILIGWWILLAMALVSSILQGFAGYKLLGATDSDKDLKDAISSCRLWQGIAIFSIFVEIWASLSLLLGQRLPLFGAFAYILLRISAVCCVQMHIKNLKIKMADSGDIVEPKYKFSGDNTDTIKDFNVCAAVGWTKA